MTARTTTPQIGESVWEKLAVAWTGSNEHDDHGAAAGRNQSYWPQEGTKIHKKQVDLL